MSAAVSPAGIVGPQAYIRPPRTPAEKYEHLAFTFCRMGTVGLIAWLVSPAIFVLAVALIAIVLYARSITLGVSWSKCFLRRPTLIIGAWAAIAAADVVWLFVLGGHLPA
ncbi:MAG TPA: hypothetical protein VKC59_03950 [Candidatus Limnocylindrales bacterium]|nr:hypothetical protein [Candidatus Limnocylindrales bacterium]